MAPSPLLIARKSSSSFLVIVWAIWSPSTSAFSVVPSWARVIVSSGPATDVTRTISAFACVGIVLTGQTVALNGGGGHVSARAVRTRRLVP